MTKLDRFTSTRDLMAACSWMSVRQLVSYHSLIQLHKTLDKKTPAYLCQRVTSGGTFPYNTRQGASGQLRLVDGPVVDLDITKLRWGFRAVEDYNKLPPDIRFETRLPAFKRKLRNWVIGNVSI